MARALAAELQRGRCCLLQGGLRLRDTVSIPVFFDDWRPTMGKVYGYARVSTREQNLDRQMDALGRRGVGVEHVFTDKATGANFGRPGYERLVQALRKGDLLVISSIDRLGRDYDEIQEQWRVLTREIRADVEVLDMPLLNTRNGIGGITGVFLADIVLQIMCYLAQMERDKIKQRQREGIDAAKARGTRFGHPSIEIPEEFDAVLAAYRKGEMTRAEAARRLGVSKSTFDRWRKGAAA